MGALSIAEAHLVDDFGKTGRDFRFCLKLPVVFGPFLQEI